MLIIEHADTYEVEGEGVQLYIISTEGSLDSVGEGAKNISIGKKNEIPL